MSNIGRLKDEISRLRRDMKEQFEYEFEQRSASLRDELAVAVYRRHTHEGVSLNSIAKVDYGTSNWSTVRDLFRRGKKIIEGRNAEKLAGTDLGYEVRVQGSTVTVTDRLTGDIAEFTARDNPRGLAPKVKPDDQVNEVHHVVVRQTDARLMQKINDELGWN